MSASLNHVLPVPLLALMGLGWVLVCAEVARAVAGPLARYAAVRAAAQPVEDLEDGTPGPARAVLPNTRRRTALVGVLVAVGLVAGPWLLSSLGLGAAGGAVAAFAFATLGLGSLLVALVDADTLYIDLPIFALTAAGSWALSLVALAVSGQLHRAVVGVAVGVGAAVLFEVLNAVARFLRGVDGQGFGDTLLVLATAGVPAALTGSVAVGYVAVMAAAVLGIVAHLLTGLITGLITRLITGTGGVVSHRQLPAGGESLAGETTGGEVTPAAGGVDGGAEAVASSVEEQVFAFGPWLAAGWPLAWALYAALSR